jgi:hypothetical protein
MFNYLKISSFISFPAGMEFVVFVTSGGMNQLPT